MIGNLLRNYGKSDHDSAAPADLEVDFAGESREERAFRHSLAPKHGPRQQGWITAGQQRRAQARTVATLRRKTNLRHRRDWMRNERSVAALRGQLQVVGVIPFANPHLVVSQDDALHHNTIDALEKRYGSVDAAAEHYASILAERAA